ncbi:MAG: hypothetical protein JWO89_1465 [Verrucomicrobiaceae bacterium]|nr:hypothetical protein [Verrucomicrobiaceae bacterium]
MKLLPSHSLTVRWLSVMVIAASLAGVSRIHAEGVDVASIQEQGDEMSRQVGGFFRKLFYGEDRNSNQQPQYQAPQRQYQQAPQPYHTAPQQQSGYQYAPPPASNNQGSAPPPQRQRPAPQQAPATVSRKAPSRIAEPQKLKHKEEPASIVNRSSSKRPPVHDAPSKHEDEPAGKQVSKRKSYTPPTLAGDDSSEAKPKKTPKSEPPAPMRKESLAKSSHQDEPPAHKFEPSETKSTPPASKDERGGISPYADAYAGGTTVMAPKETPSTKPKTEEPKKETKLNTPAAVSDGSFPTGTKSKTNPGSVVSPYSPYNELDVSGLPSGSLSIDPTTNKVFKVP